MIPAGFCQCGCGARTAISNRNWKRFGYIKGQPFAFLPGHNRRVSRRPDVYSRQRVAGSQHGSVLEHRLLAEQALGKPLPKGVQVHHVDGNRRNNAPTNLVICQDQSYHLLLHARTRTLRAGGNPNADLVCGKCSTVKPLDAFSRQSSNKSIGRRTICRACSAAAFAEWEARKAAKGKAA